MYPDVENIIYDLAIANGWILCLDKEFSEYRHGLVLIRNNKIEYVGEESDAPTYRAINKVDCQGGLVLPCFINGHSHAAMSLFRGMGNDKPLDTWLRDYMWPAEAKFANPDNVYLGSMVSAIEMVRSGTGAFSDMYFFQEETFRACEDLGIRLIMGEGILDFPTPNKKNPTEGIEYTETLYKKYKDKPLVSFTIPAHSPYTCSPEVLAGIGELSKKLKIPASIHLAETEWETGEMMKRYGKSSAQLLRDVGFFDFGAVAYHCNHLSAEDIRILKEYNVGVVSNPRSNMKLGSGICPVPGLLEEGIKIGVGTDGAASNNNQAVLLDMQLLARLQKMHALDPTVINAREAVKMASLNNAEIYGLDNRIGSIETGKLADLIVIDTDQAHWQPLHDPYSGLVYAMQPDDVVTTIINGKIIMQDRQIKTIDEKKYQERIIKTGKKINNLILP